MCTSFLFISFLPWNIFIYFLISFKKIKCKSFIFTELISCNDRFDQEGWKEWTKNDRAESTEHQIPLFHSQMAINAFIDELSRKKKQEMLNDWWLCTMGYAWSTSLMARATKQTRTHVHVFTYIDFSDPVFICV